MSTYTGDHLVEQPAIQLMQHELGWDVENCYDEWSGGVSNQGRDGKREVVLVLRLRPALQHSTPLYTFEEPYLTLKIFRSSKGVERVASGAALQKLNRNERKGWDWLVSVADATAPEYADALKVSRSTALNHLNRFVEHGLAIRSGAGPATRYKATIE